MEGQGEKHGHHYEHGIDQEGDDPGHYKINFSRPPSGSLPDIQQYDDIVHRRAPQGQGQRQGRGQIQNPFQGNNQESFTLQSATYDTGLVPQTEGPSKDRINEYRSPRLSGQSYDGQRPPKVSMDNPKCLPLSAAICIGHGGITKAGASLGGSGYIQVSCNNDYTNHIQQPINRNMYPDSATTDTGYHYPSSRNPTPPQGPILAPCQPVPHQTRPTQSEYFLQPPNSIPLIRFPQTQNHRIVDGSTSDPLDPNVYEKFPVPAEHRELLYMNAAEYDIQSCYCVDDGPQKVDESQEDYITRVQRAILHMGIEDQRRILPPIYLDGEAQRNWPGILDGVADDHRQKMNPEGDESEDDQKYSDKRCLECAERKISCSIKTTRRPCKNCEKNERQCLQLPLEQQGVKLGTRRGPYNKSNLQRQKGTSKGGGGGRRKKIFENEPEDEQPPPSPPQRSDQTRKRC
jgi:hypothetical protein